MNHLLARVLSRQNYQKKLLFSVLSVCLLALLLGVLSLSRATRGGAEAAGMWFAANAPGIQDACPMVSQLSPATGIPGSNLMVTGSNLGTVTGVKFAGDVAAAFTIVNNSTLNIVIPNGVSTGPLTLSKAGCPDVQTSAFAYSVNLNPNNELSVDDGTMEGVFGSQTGMIWYVNRLTPTSYPATVTKLAIFFNQNSGTPFDLIVGTNPGGGANIDSAKFIATPATVSGVEAFTIYDVPPVTITSGDFLVGFRKAAASNIAPAAPFDANSQARNRSYISTGGLTFTPAASQSLPFVNFSFRAGIVQGCPNVTGVSPMAGAAGTSVTLTGANLTGVTGVRFFNNATAQYTIFGITQITTTVPNAAVTGPITLSKTGCPNMTAPVFLVGACPSVSGISSTSGAVGANVTISGTNFTGATSVKFANNVTAAFTVNSNTQITATVPSGAVTGPITVSKPDCPDAQTAGFTVLACPTITGINPASGIVGGTVTITGTNFTGVTSVKFANNVTASFTVNSATSITATIPAGAVSGSITLSKPDCPDTQTASFSICPAISITPTSLPNGTIGAAYSQTVTALPAGAYNFTVTAGTLPVGLSLNATTGAITGTPSVAGTANFTIIALSAGPCSGSHAYSITIQPACPTVTNLIPTSGQAGATVTITGTNFTGVTAVKFANNVTANFTVNNDSSMAATVPAGAVTGPITISKTGCADVQTASLTIACPTIAVAPASLPNGTLGAVYNQTVTASPAGTYNFTVTAGILPAGLSLNATTGAITGTPSAVGTANFTITALGAGSCSGSQAYSITIQPVCLTITNLSPTSGQVGASVTLTGTNFIAVTAVKFTNNITANFIVNNDSSITAIVPAGAVTGPITISKTGCADVQTASFTITCPAITLAPVSLPGGTVGSAYSQILTASGGTASYSFALTAGALPGGLTLASGGTLSGTPNAAGTFNFTVTATDANGCMGARSFTVNITDAPSTQFRALYVFNECDGCGNQIYGYAVNEATGTLTLLPGFPVLTGGNGGSGVYSERLAIDRANRRLYAINDSTDTVSAYAINPTTGALTPLPFSPINLGSGTWVTLAVHPSGSPLVVGDGNILNRKLASYQITATTASPAFGSPYNTGSAVAFSSAFSQDGDYLYMGGTAFNNLLAGFSVNAATGVLTALAGSPFNSGATNPLAYATDASGRLFLANFDAGQVRAFTTVGGVPNAVSGNPFASGLTSIIHGILHPNGFYLVADRSSRVGIYQINGSGSATTLNAVTGSPFSTGGIEADVLALNQAGTFLFVADGSGRNLKTFGINPTTGTLAFFATQPANTLGLSGRLNGMAYFAPPCETISLSPAMLPGGTVGAAYNQTVSASPSGNYNFSVIAGALPAGLSLNAATGAITGTPTAAGTANFTITATGASDCSGSRAYSITIQIQCPTVASVTPATVTVGGVVTINGSGFTGVSAVRFANNLTANFAVVSDTQITATAPTGAVNGPVTISKIGCADVQTAPLVIHPVNTPRVVRVVNASGAPGSQVMVPIELVSQGNENALGFSLNFDTAILSNPQAALGSGAAGGQITSNPSQIAQGRLGLLVSLPSGQRFSAGARQIALVTFTIAANAIAGTTAISFGDQPLAREISDPEANVLPADYVAGAVTIAPGFEADVSPRPQGSNDGTVTVTDYVQVGRFVARLDVPAPGSEFQRADCAPRASLGDGRLTVTDYVQAGRYATGLDPVTTAGGPAEPVSQLSVVRGQLPKTTDNRQRAAAQVRAAQETLAAAGLLEIELDAQGGENALAFSLQFDPAQWRFVSALAGEDAVGITLHVNAEEVAAGRIGILLALPAGETFAAGTHKVALLRFAPVPGRRSASVIGFADQPLAREVVNVQAEQVPAEYAVRTEAFTARTAVSVSAASFGDAELASESIAAAFGEGLAMSTQAAESLPLPFDLAGTRVTVRDSEDIERQAPLFFVSPGQVNYLIPADTAAGLATVTITSGDGAVSIGAVRIAAPAPGLFAANADGQGIASAILLRTRADGSQQFEPVSRFDSKLNRVVATPIELGPEGEQVFLILFGTGLRHHNSPVTSSVEIGGVPAEVLFIGSAPGFAGLDQCNVRLPRNLVGRGEVEVFLTVDGKAANPVSVMVK